MAEMKTPGGETPGQHDTGMRPHTMQTKASVHDDAPDPQFDTSPAHLAQLLGQRAVQMVRDGRDPAHTARLAASYAFQAEPTLRVIES